MNNEQEKRTYDQVDENGFEADANRDPITGQPGAHPVGTGLGAAAAGTIGTALGAIAGPVGAGVGAVAGSVVGGLVGKSTAEVFDPTIEDTYWRENYTSRPYVQPGYSYDDYHPAYRTGYEGYHRYYADGRTYEEVEPELQRDYETNYRTSRVGWNDAKHATRDAWERIEHSFRNRSNRETL
ncbi:MAG: hypothetical protein IGS48_15305 [Oscillatoriales cyanobacterium C42_A2020_001]|nr:hypothetical protein [Leptolyngbyaceae cyanobacterium C42_A2020_001]